ncbi:hypothetical protein PCASD_08633 [Puccinia coronata f. sp. avenae]|uniref:Uncharacterized protein n=1 Tax=Puccinia coronata f. sp. avenae TaxID=200324 RepID=A0A2N5V7E5_9BASI|nr:hypothetical protein PCASD_08633 [Puccinia coronata f. sp. avenae]
MGDCPTPVYCSPATGAGAPDKRSVNPQLRRLTKRNGLTHMRQQRSPLDNQTKTQSSQLLAETAHLDPDTVSCSNPHIKRTRAQRYEHPGHLYSTLAACTYRLGDRKIATLTRFMCDPREA